MKRLLSSPESKDGGGVKTKIAVSKINYYIIVIARRGFTKQEWGLQKKQLLSHHISHFSLSLTPNTPHPIPGCSANNEWILLFFFFVFFFFELRFLFSKIFLRAGQGEYNFVDVYLSGQLTQKCYVDLQFCKASWLRYQGSQKSSRAAWSIRNPFETLYNGVVPENTHTFHGSVLVWTPPPLPTCTLTRTHTPLWKF